MNNLSFKFYLLRKRYYNLYVNNEKIINHLIFPEPNNNFTLYLNADLSFNLYNTTLNTAKAVLVDKYIERNIYRYLLP